nr:acyltransferase family protein [Streptococcus halichoeri]
MLQMTRKPCADNNQYNTSMISLLQYLFSILVILVHSGRLFSQDAIHFTFKSFLGRMAVPYFLICTAFFLRGRMHQGLCHQAYFRKLIKKYSIWTLIYLPYSYFFFESLNIAKVYLLPGFIVAFLYLGMSHTLWYIPAVILGWVIIQGLLKYLGTRGTVITVVALYCIGALETYSAFVQPTKFYPLISAYMSVFQTTRNGLFYTPIYLLAGYLLYDYFNTELFTTSRGLKYTVFLLLLAVENVLIYFNQGLDKNFFLLGPLCAVFLFNWSIRTSLFKDYCLSHLKQLSVYYFFLHPLFIGIVSYCLKATPLAVPNQGKVIFVVTLALTHASALLIMKGFIKLPYQKRLSLSLLK